MSGRVDPTLLEQCGKCDKLIPNDEWVDNWGICNECFDRHYDEVYLISRKEDETN